MRFTKAKIVAAGMILAGICMIAPQQLRAEVPKTQMDGVMGQSIKEEMDDTQISDVDTQRDGLLSTYAIPRLLGASKASSGYTQDFLDGSFTSKVDYTSVTYYHKSDYEDAQLLNGIDVSWWQAKNKKTTALNWEKIHDAGIDFAFVRVASRDTSDGSIYEDTAANSHIQAALENDINVGLYIFSQALTEKEAKQEAEYVLDLADKYGWDVTLPIVIDRENSPKQKRQRSASHLQIRFPMRDISRLFMLHMHGSNPILIQILWRIAASGLRGTIIRQRAMQKEGNLMQTQHMTMNSGSIHPLQK